ncbi:MAG: peptidylprolyl isomerase [Pirellulaceae bacterium]|nr:peptidylprolyl isomerase [Pirellulaceae bacterium]
MIAPKNQRIFFYIKGLTLCTLWIGVCCTTPLYAQRQGQQQSQRNQLWQNQARQGQNLQNRRGLDNLQNRLDGLGIGQSQQFTTQQNGQLNRLAFNQGSQNFGDMVETSPKTFILENTKIIARVGGQTVLVGDLIGDINQQLKQFEGKAPPEELAQAREIMLKRLLASHIDTVAVYDQFMQKVPPERVADLEKELAKHFRDTQQKQMIEALGVQNAEELEAKLQEAGTSLANYQRIFKMQLLFQQVIQEQLNFFPEVPHQELWDYYQAHLEDYKITAKVRYEKITLLFEKVDSKPNAYRQMANIGNELLRGRSFADLAKQFSHGLHADTGGINDWTTQGALKSTVIDQALFSLPVGKFSRILEDENGFHIVRVLDRVEEGYTSFTDTQEIIRAKLINEKKTKQLNELITKYRNETEVWTIFDGDTEFEKFRKEQLVPPSDG